MAGFSLKNATTIEGDGSSSISGNVAANYGGVYAHEYYNEDWALAGGTFSHTLGGALVVKDNTATDGSGYNNYCIEVNRDHWVNNRSSFKLGEGAEVWLSVIENPGLDFVNETIHDTRSSIRLSTRLRHSSSHIRIGATMRGSKAQLRMTYRAGEDEPTTAVKPVKQADAQYTYTFAGWMPEIDRVSDDATYKATYTNTLRTYKVAFVNDDGTVLQESELAYGETPEYTGATPTKAAIAELVYVFKGWDQEITDVTGDATYKATYIEVPYTDKYYCAEGFGTTWTKGSGDSLRLTFKRIEDDDQTFNRFAGIQVDAPSR